MINHPVRPTRPGHALELEIPPVALVIGAALLMWLAAAYAPGLNVRFPLQSVVAWVIGLSGISAVVEGTGGGLRIGDFNWREHDRPLMAVCAFIVQAGGSAGLGI